MVKRSGSNGSEGILELPVTGVALVFQPLRIMKFRFQFLRGTEMN